MYLQAAAQGLIPQLPIVNADEKSVFKDKVPSNVVTTFVLSTGRDDENTLAVADAGAFSVTPLKSCPHVQSVKDMKAVMSSAHKNQCQKCGVEKENWICFATGKCLCGRYVQGHMLQHATETGHSVCISLEDLSVWCFKCEAYLDPFAIIPVREVFSALHEEKFGTKPAIPKGQTESFAGRVVLRGKDEDVSTKADESVDSERD
jgi:hypothetical protein